ncbi:hypothetical protein [Lentzea xinjiangensis]|nr:hypothetical protein [Lentzea xinjiangensis]
MNRPLRTAVAVAPIVVMAMTSGIGAVIAAGEPAGRLMAAE